MRISRLFSYPWYYEAASRLPSSFYRFLHPPTPFRFPVERAFRPSPPFPPFSFPSLLKGVRAAPFDGSMILLRHYRASQTPNCSAYSPYYLT